MQRRDDGRSERRTVRLRIAIGVLAVIAVVAGACGDADERRAADIGTSPAVDGETTGRGWIGADGDLEWSEPATGADGGALAADDRAATAELAAESEVAGDAGSAVPPGAPEPGPEPGPVPPPEPIDTALRAGSVDDNEQWEDYLLYRQDILAAGVVVHDVDVAGRQMIRVTDESGASVLGATVEVVDGSGAVVARRTTHADGRAMFFAPPADDPQARSGSLVARVTLGDITTEAALSSESLVHDVTLPVARAEAAVALDVLFLIDATGSMGDEIEQLKANMVSVAEQVDALEARPDVRFAMTVYRDEGDLFVTRTFDFTSDVAAFTGALREVVAGGGGDYPEALDRGLRDALDQPAWRDGQAVRLVFLVADAPPHLGDGFDRSDVDYATDALDAAERGVKIHPIASSGLDDQGEYVMRQLAQLTLGRFNFLTYGADGASPGDSTPHHVDDYSVLSLDALVVQLVADELAAL